MTASPGPDRLTSRQHRAVPLGALSRILSIILWRGKLPAHHSISLTIFIPDKTAASQLEDFRLISLPSVLTRLLHKVLAQRLDGAIYLDEAQRAFRAGIYGCRDNTVLLDAILKSRYTSYKSLHIATLDMVRAFYSVEHSTLLTAVAAAGLPAEFVEYLRGLYSSGCTRLSAMNGREHHSG